jgi:hypothetical protein
MAKRTRRPKGAEVRTGRRENPAIEGPRDRTVCFMLSEQEKTAVDRVAFCLNRTRSGALANVAANFFAATKQNKEGRTAEKALLGYLRECREAVKRRGAIADKTIASMKGHNDE